jgi:transcriptional regulator with GAF, ATPase, and Fis domain
LIAFILQRARTAQHAGLEVETPSIHWRIWGLFLLQVAMPELIGKAAPARLHYMVASSELSEAAERARILKALDEAKGQVGGPDGAAARLGLKRTTLQARMRKYRIARKYH